VLELYKKLINYACAVKFAPFPVPRPCAACQMQAMCSHMCSL